MFALLIRFKCPFIIFIILSARCSMFVVFSQKFRCPSC